MKTKTFRLINTTTWKVETFEIGTFPPYLAVSHAWTDNFFPKKLPLDQSPGSNAIRQTIVKRGFTTVQYCWVDLFCIKQDSEDDMNEQIPLMGHIYGSAQAVLIMLTNKLELTQKQVDEGTVELKDAVKAWEKHHDIKEEVIDYWGYGEGRAKLVKAMEVLSRFANPSWGTRVWTLQEYILATNVLWIGSDLEPISIEDALFTAIPGLCTWVQINECTVLNDGLAERQKLLHSHFSGMSASRIGAIDRTRIMEMLGNRQAFLPVDEIYGIMAASTVEISIQPKETRENAWKRWLEAALIAGHLRWLMLPPALASTAHPSDLTCWGVLCSKRHELSYSSNLDTVTPYGPVIVSDGTVSLTARRIGECTVLRELGQVHRCAKGWIHRHLTAILFAKGNWFSAIDIAVAFGAGRYNNGQLIRLAQVLKNNYSRALRFVQRKKEEEFNPIWQSLLHRKVWADFMQLMSRVVMDPMNFGVGHLVRVQCPITQLPFLTALVTDGRPLSGCLVAFHCGAETVEGRYVLLVGESPVTGVPSQVNDPDLIWHKAGVTLPVGEDYAVGWDKIPLETINIGGSKCQVCKIKATSSVPVTLPPSRGAKPARDCARMIRQVLHKHRGNTLLEVITRRVFGPRLNMKRIARSRRRSMLLKNLHYLNRKQSQ